VIVLKAILPTCAAVCWINEKKQDVTLPVGRGIDWLEERTTEIPSCHDTSPFCGASISAGAAS
jgi:hypothetical protein